MQAADDLGRGGDAVGQAPLALAQRVFQTPFILGCALAEAAQRLRKRARITIRTAIRPKGVVPGVRQESCLFICITLPFFQ